MKLLAAVDLSESTDKIMKTVKEFAGALSANVWILHVAEPEPDFVGFKVGPKYIRDSRSATFHSEHCQIQGIADRLRMAGLEATALLVQGATVEIILKEASKLNVDLIILGSHEHSILHQFVMGSISKGVLHRSECPVLIIPTH